jgi:transcriptional regulator with XRE-family HTH domain
MIRMGESLREYVKRLMDEKNLGVREVERNSGGKISASHVSKVLSGEAENLTASKIVGLALGLKVDPHEIFSVITGYKVPEAPAADMVAFAEIVQKLVSNPRLLEIVKLWTRIPAKEEAVLLRSLQFGKRQRTKDRKKNH